jgi:hypothetical protein
MSESILGGLSLFFFHLPHPSPHPSFFLPKIGGSTGFPTVGGARAPPASVLAPPLPPKEINWVHGVCIQRPVHTLAPASLHTKHDVRGCPIIELGHLAGHCVHTQFFPVLMRVISAGGETWTNPKGVTQAIVG